MFGSKKNKSSDNTRSKRNVAPSLISRDMNIMGNLISDGVVDIDGHIEGNVRAERITVRKDGIVNGDLHADEIHVYGKVTGLVRSKDVHLFSSCKVEGTIMHELLSMEEGAFVDGKFKRTDRGYIDDKMMLSSDIDETEEDTSVIMENIRLISSNSD